MNSDNGMQGKQEMDSEVRPSLLYQSHETPNRLHNAEYFTFGDLIKFIASRDGELGNQLQLSYDNYMSQHRDHLINIRGTQCSNKQEGQVNYPNHCIPLQSNVEAHALTSGAESWHSVQRIDSEVDSQGEERPVINENSTARRFIRPCDGVISGNLTWPQRENNKDGYIPSADSDSDLDKKELSLNFPKVINNGKRRRLRRKATKHGKSTGIFSRTGQLRPLASSLKTSNTSQELRERLIERDRLLKDIKIINQILTESQNNVLNVTWKLNKIAQLKQLEANLSLTHSIIESLYSKLYSRTEVPLHPASTALGYNFKNAEVLFSKLSLNPNNKVLNTEPNIPYSTVQHNNMYNQMNEGTEPYKMQYGTVPNRSSMIEQVRCSTVANDCDLKPSAVPMNINMHTNVLYMNAGEYYGGVPRNGTVHNALPQTVPRVGSSTVLTSEIKPKYTNALINIKNEVPEIGTVNFNSTVPNMIASINNFEPITVHSTPKIIVKHPPIDKSTKPREERMREDRLAYCEKGMSDLYENMNKMMSKMDSLISNISGENNILTYSSNKEGLGAIYQGASLRSNARNRGRGKSAPILNINESNNSEIELPETVPINRIKINKNANSSNGIPICLPGKYHVMKDELDIPKYLESTYNIDYVKTLKSRFLTQDGLASLSIAYNEMTMSDIEQAELIEIYRDYIRANLRKTNVSLSENSQNRSLKAAAINILQYETGAINANIASFMRDFEKDIGPIAKYNRRTMSKLLGQFLEPNALEHYNALGGASEPFHALKYKMLQTLQVNEKKHHINDRIPDNIIYKDGESACEFLGRLLSEAKHTCRDGTVARQQAKQEFIERIPLHEGRAIISLTSQNESVVESQSELDYAQIEHAAKVYDVTTSNIASHKPGTKFNGNQTTTGAEPNQIM